MIAIRFIIPVIVIIKVFVSESFEYLKLIVVLLSMCLKLEELHIFTLGVLGIGININTAISAVGRRRRRVRLSDGCDTVQFIGQVVPVESIRTRTTITTCFARSPFRAFGVVITTFVVGMRIVMKGCIGFINLWENDVCAAQEGDARKRVNCLLLLGCNGATTIILISIHSRTHLHSCSTKFIVFLNGLFIPHESFFLQLLVRCDRRDSFTALTMNGVFLQNGLDCLWIAGVFHVVADTTRSRHDWIVECIVTCRSVARK